MLVLMLLMLLMLLVLLVLLVARADTLLAGGGGGTEGAARWGQHAAAPALALEVHNNPSRCVWIPEVSFCC